MKKLLLTLFAVAAIVACQKDDSVIEPTGAMLEIGDVQIVENNYDTSEIFDLLRDADIAAEDGSSKDASSARTTLSNECVDGRESRDGDRLDVSLVQHVSGLHAVIRSENEIPLTGGAAAAFSLIKNGNTINILVGTTASGSFPTNSGMDFLFGIDSLLDISRVDQELFVLQANVAASDLGLDCSPIQGLYDVTPAPFPLNGWLATIKANVGTASFTGTSLNYAGTDEAAVRAAIEADIMNGN